MTEKNASFWLSRCKTLYDPKSVESQGTDINKELLLSTGDTIWLARRSRAPAVRIILCIIGLFLNKMVHLRVAQHYWDVKDRA